MSRNAHSFYCRKGLILAEVEKIVHDLVQPIADERNLELVDVEYVKEGSSYYLRIYLDKENGIDIEEIAATSELISEALDSLEPDPFPVAYLLEVSLICFLLLVK